MALFVIILCESFRQYRDQGTITRQINCAFILNGLIVALIGLLNRHIKPNQSLARPWYSGDKTNTLFLFVFAFLDYLKNILYRSVCKNFIRFVSGNILYRVVFI